MTPVRAAESSIPEFALEETYRGNVPRKPTWEDADLLLRIEQIAAHPQTRAALDWFERTAGEAGEMTAHRIPREAREFEHVQRLLELYELLGTLARQELISEPLVQHRWPSHALWQFLAPTIDRERKSVGPFVGENFEWLAQRSRHGATKPSVRPLR